MYGEIRIGMIGVTKIDQLNNDDWGYLSPQMLQNQPYTNKTDIWLVQLILLLEYHYLTIVLNR